ncbi:unnamed protein product [Lasius platythorax]|uniref:Uncharacterized protein n=1 Tax=Lasius platythorax TaxID=488582 RepID=A0AAV2NAH4_9HYME
MIFVGLWVAPSHAKDRIKCLRKSYTLMNYFSLPARRGRLGNSVKNGGSFAVPGSPPRSPSPISLEISSDIVVGRTTEESS